MEQDILRSAWQGMVAPPKTDAALKGMMHDNAHPVLKRIRRQLIIETVAFTVFLFVYYDFFDGDRKPVFTNVLLVAGLLLVIIHNIAGYVLMKKPLHGNSIKQMLYGHLVTIKRFAVISVISRILVAGCLLLFFTRVITFTTGKYWMLAAIIIVFIIQISLLSAIWAKRIKQLRGTITDFDVP